MREIKFRGKRVDNGEWVVGNYATFDLNESGGNKNTTVIILENSFYADYEWLDKFYKIHKETLGQFTGLKDKNGVEIYEGDIVSTQHIDIVPKKYETEKEVIKTSGGWKTIQWFEKSIVEWINDEMRFAFRNITNGSQHIMIDCEHEVIGNIHEEDKEKLK